MIKKSVLSLVSIMALSGLAYAGGDMTEVLEPVIEVPEVIVDDSGFYLGLGYSYVAYESSFITGGSAEDADGNAILLLAGYDFNKYIALEGRYSMTLGDLSYNNNNINSEISNVGLYLKPMLPLEYVTLYGLLGYGKVTVDFTGNGFDKLTESGFQWGLGASTTVTDNVSLFVDYTSLYNGTGMNGSLSNYPNFDFDIDSVNVGVTYKF